MLNKSVVFAPEAGSSLRFLILSLDVHHLEPVFPKACKKKRRDTFIPVFCNNQTTRLLQRSVSLHQSWGLWISLKENFRVTTILEIDCSVSLCLANVELCRADVGLRLTTLFSLSGKRKWKEKSEKSSLDWYRGGRDEKAKKKIILQQHCMNWNVVFWVFFVLKAWRKAPSPPSPLLFLSHTGASHTHASGMHT